MYAGSPRWVAANCLSNLDFVNLISQLRNVFENTMYLCHTDGKEILNINFLDIENMALAKLSMMNLWGWYYTNYYFVNMNKSLAIQMICNVATRNEFTDDLHARMIAAIE